MPTLAGLLTGTALLLAALNLTPGVQVTWLWQVAASVSLLVINFFVWKRTTPPPMPLREAVVAGAVGFSLIAAVAVIDTFFGFLFGAQTVLEAFIHSGAFGGIADAFLFVCGLFIGVPTLVKSVLEFHLRPRP